MKRRDFMLLASAGVVAVSIPAVHYFFYAVPDYNKKLSAPQSLSLIWDDETVRAVGTKYIKQFPDEDSERALAVSLFEDAPDPSVEALDVRTREDFTQDRTVIIDGWVLSKTEARQCALQHLLKKA